MKASSKETKRPTAPEPEERNINFMAPVVLRELAERHAEEQDMSLSAYLRRLMRKDLQRSGLLPANGTDG